MAATDRGFSESLSLVRPLDEEQARLVEILLAARGADVSFEELRRQGIENPAVLAYELEIAGLPIAHVQRLKDGGRATSVGLRLDGTGGHEAASQDRAREAGFLAPDPVEEFETPIAGPPTLEHARPGLLPAAVTAAAILVLVVLVVALVNGPGPSSPSRRHASLTVQSSGSAPAGRTAQSGRGASAAATHKRHHANATHAASTEPAPPPSPAARLQLAGHQLLQEGRYAAAIPELRASLNASGESASNCSEPTTPGCVAYAEALYDLGRALRLDNASAAAGAVLRERLQIDSQREAVRNEIGLNSKRRAQSRAKQRATRPTTRTSRPRTSTPGASTPGASAPHPTTKPAPAPEPGPNPGGAAAPESASTAP